MTFKYRVGQLVTIVDANGDWGPDGRKYLGAVATIIWAQTFTRFEHNGNSNYYGLDCRPDYAFAEVCLKPLNDGDCPSTWDECAWRPPHKEPVLPSTPPVTEKEAA